MSRVFVFTTDPEEPVSEAKAKRRARALARREAGLPKQQYASAAEMWADPAYRARRRAAAKASWQDPEKRANRCNAMRQAWSNPSARARARAAAKEALARPEVRARKSRSKKAQWANPEYRARNMAGMRAFWDDPDNRAQRSIETKLSWLKRRERALTMTPELKATAKRLRELGVPEINIQHHLAKGVRKPEKSPHYVRGGSWRPSSYHPAVAAMLDKSRKSQRRQRLPQHIIDEWDAS